MSPRLRHRHARLSRTARSGVFLVALGLAIIVGFVVTHRPTVSGSPSAVRAPATRTPAAPLTPQPGWTTLSNPESGLSYQIPPNGWRTNPRDGTVAQVTLTQGAERTGYTCGKPLERLIRGVLGSGAAPRTDPAALAEVIAQAAAGQYYATEDRQPRVTVAPASPVLRHTGAGTVVHGALATAIARQDADRCLATTGEVLVLVLQFPDHDGVLLVNADVAGGPKQPAPATDRELRTIIGTAHPTD